MTYPRHAYEYQDRLNQPTPSRIQPMHEPTWLERLCARLMGRG